MQLFIAEKPELARAIADAIGIAQQKHNGYIKVEDNYITWCFGHLLCLKDPQDYDAKYKRWNLEDLPFNIPNMQLKPIEGKQKQIEIIKQLLKNATSVVNAGDPDEEGQLLVDELLEFLANKKPVKRILINDNTKEAVKKSLQNLKNNEDFVGLKNSAYVRSVGDWKYGLNLTRAYTLQNNKGGVLSVGRVQTPILAMVFNREQEIANHSKEFYYTLKTNNNFIFNIPKSNLEEGLCKNKDYMVEVMNLCNLHNDFTIVAVDTIKQDNQPPLPYNLLELQADAFKKFKYKPDEVKNITQNLREKYKAITYNRSDCQYLSDEHYEQKNDVIASIKANLNQHSNVNLNMNLKHRAFNSKNVSAHHAIIPTTTKIDINALNLQEQNIYNLIAKRYLLLFMEPQIIEKTTYIATNSQKLEFSAINNKLISTGYKAFDKDNTKEDNDIEEDVVDNEALDFKVNDKCNFKTFNVIENQTKPKILYTFATLLKDLTCVAKYVKNLEIKNLLLQKDKDKKGESGGIGTPATRDAIIKNLFDRGFLVEHSGKIITTQIAKDFLTILPQSAKVPDMTALWSAKQEEIRQNIKNYI